LLYWTKRIFCPEEGIAKMSRPARDRRRPASKDDSPCSEGVRLIEKAHAKIAAGKKPLEKKAETPEYEVPEEEDDDEGDEEDDEEDRISKKMASSPVGEASTSKMDLLQRRYKNTTGSQSSPLASAATTAEAAAKTGDTSSAPAPTSSAEKDQNLVQELLQRLEQERKEKELLQKENEKIKKELALDMTQNKVRNYYY
jgi:hypothetical protein